jgi:hypothetical protein
MAKNKEKDFTPELKCEHCNNTAPMEVVARHSQMRVVDERSGYEAGRIYELIKCPACAEVTLWRYYWADHMDPSEVQSFTLYPTQTNMPTGLPEQIATAYEAALRVRNVDANAYGVLIGRLLEMICEDRQAKGDTLAAKLSDLSAKGEIPEKLVGVASSLRGFRNVGAHAELGELTKADVPFGSIPFLVEIANGSIGSRHLFEAAFQVRLQRSAQADQLLAAAHLA